MVQCNEAHAHAISKPHIHQLTEVNRLLKLGKIATYLRRDNDIFTVEEWTWPTNQDNYPTKPGQKVAPGELFTYCKKNNITLPYCFCLDTSDPDVPPEACIAQIGRSSPTKGGYYYFTCHTYIPGEHKAGSGFEDDTGNGCGYFVSLQSFSNGTADLAFKTPTKRVTPAQNKLKRKADEAFTSLDSSPGSQLLTLSPQTASNQSSGGTSSSQRSSEGTPSSPAVGDLVWPARRFSRPNTTAGPSRPGGILYDQVTPDFLDSYGAIRVHHRLVLDEAVFSLGSEERTIAEGINKACLNTSGFCYSLDQPEGLDLENFNWLFSRCYCGYITTRRFHNRHRTCPSHRTRVSRERFSVDPLEEVLALSPVSTYLTVSVEVEESSKNDLSTMQAVWRLITEKLDHPDGLEVDLFARLFVQCGDCRQVMTSRMLENHFDGICFAHIN